jgi:mono/diheme cytochrome c family protein
MRPLLAPLCLAPLLAAPLAAQEAATVAPAARGAELFADFCATCHGAAARGDGPMADVLAVEVPDLTGLAARAGGTFPHYDVVAKIDGRDPVTSHGGAMPVWGPVFEGVEAGFVRTEAGQPIVTSEPIAALVAWLEGVQEE